MKKTKVIEHEVHVRICDICKQEGTEGRIYPQREVDECRVCGRDVCNSCSVHISNINVNGTICLECAKKKPIEWIINKLKIRPIF